MYFLYSAEMHWPVEGDRQIVPIGRNPGGPLQSGLPIRPDPFHSPIEGGPLPVPFQWDFLFGRHPPNPK